MMTIILKKSRSFKSLHKCVLEQLPSPLYPLVDMKNHFPKNTQTKWPVWGLTQQNWCRVYTDIAKTCLFNSINWSNFDKLFLVRKIDNFWCIFLSIIANYLHLSYSQQMHTPWFKGTPCWQDIIEINAVKISK